MYKWHQIPWFRDQISDYSDAYNHLSGLEDLIKEENFVVYYLSLNNYSFTLTVMMSSELKSGLSIVIIFP